MASLCYDFILSMWVAGSVTEAWVRKQQAKGRITESEMEIILATPQIQPSQEAAE